MRRDHDLPPIGAVWKEFRRFGGKQMCGKPQNEVRPVLNANRLIFFRPTRFQDSSETLWEGAVWIVPEHKVMGSHIEYSGLPEKEALRLDGAFI